MFVCLCKGLTESEVVERTRSCIVQGLREPSDLVDALELQCEESCGFCVENPQHILAIVEDELELHPVYAPGQEPARN